MRTLPKLLTVSGHQFRERSFLSLTPLTVRSFRANLISLKTKTMSLEKQYLIDGVLYKIIETTDVHRRIQNDPDFASMYVRDNSSQLEFQLQAATETGNDDTFVWTQNTIRLLLNEYEKRKDKFRTPTVKKKLLWAEIKSEFMKHDYTITTEALDKKFRNLKKTYLKIHDNNKKTSTGRDTVSWEYYDTFCKIFDSDKAICMNNTLSSMIIMTENDKIINPEVLNLPPLDLTTQLPNYSKTFDTPMDKDSPITSSNETENIHRTASESTKKAKIIKRNYGFRKDVLEVGKERLQESKKLRESLDEMVQIQKERNKILTELSEYLKK